MRQYLNNNELKEPSFFETKLPVLFLIVNLFVFQIIFHISTATLTSVAAKQNLLSFEGLTEFTFDMWFVVILFSIGLFSYSKIKKQTELLLVVFITIPSTIVLLSLVRNVSSVIVLVLVGVISFLICRFNYQKLSAKYLEDAANANQGPY
ncbi:hypothetical protein [Colwellia sp. UCD-KL20]|uniref:hypothetical protein n=1 Tax=Colwellia sp. UCD-KL20 TaxID=1917165 RepID=UPI00097101EF|nr:hypothetical protein [Colwellia sp. UCD-KL20]